MKRHAIAGAAAFLAACAVGPDYRAPEAPAAGAYTEKPQPERTESAPVQGGDAQRLQVGAKIAAEWWTVFGSPELDALIRAAIEGQPTLAAAKAALRQAEENVNAQYAVLYPSVDANLAARRQRISGASFGNPSIPSTTFNLYNASVSVTYAIDVAGGARRELEALRAGVDFQRFQVEAAYLALTANVATTAFREASLREQIRATREISEAQDAQLQLAEKQFALGAISGSDLLGQRAQAAQTRATLPPLEKALGQTRNQLAVLVGKLPVEAKLPELDFSNFRLPGDLPLSVPSDLLRQRPDVRQAEAILHQTNARIGVAGALMFPQLTVSGSFGTAALNSGDLFNPATQIWNIGANLLQPIFHAGQLAAQKRGAEAAYDQAFAQYRLAVLTAFQDVADVLLALEYDARTLKAQAEAEAAARESLEVTREQLKVGGANYLALLNAQRQYNLAKAALVQAQAARYADTAALFQALGGGWWNRELPAGGAPVTRAD
ncbi:MAG TPA: efflux transporter outer membrane subunit [Burkholderiales bacterium]|nr:efflux transporter outer membrane subunit [Burkholderiales bacterium]HYA46185.1 efflux transporter outer membrane subunit [Burkholderiales bacterium]